MRSATLPPEAARRWGHLVYVVQRGPTEYSSECPNCGDTGHSGRDYPDRFRIFTDKGKARGWCRVCGYFAFADDDKPQSNITDADRQHWLEERIIREQDEVRKAQRALELLRTEATWMHYHESLPAFGKAWWLGKGVPDWAIDLFFLGYCPSREWYANGEAFVSDSATIPVFAPGFELMNLRHRLIHPANPQDKYRPDRSGLHSAMFLTDYDRKPAGEVLIVEGEIKAIVTWAMMEHSTRFTVGVPGKSPCMSIFDILSDCDRCYVALDPDASDRAVKIAQHLNQQQRGRARIVRFHVKPDDWFTQYRGTRAAFEAAIKQAWRV